MVLLVLLTLTAVVLTGCSENAGDNTSLELQEYLDKNFSGSAGARAYWYDSITGTEFKDGTALIRTSAEHTEAGKETARAIAEAINPDAFTGCKAVEILDHDGCLLYSK